MIRRVVVGHTAADQVVFVGPFGVGKTTALRVVSDVPVVNTDVLSSEIDAALAASGKSTTTAALDYGEWQFGDGARVALIGIPGQERFDAIWDTLLPRSTAVVLWLFGDQEAGLQECRKWLDILQRRGAISRLAVAITRVPPDREDLVLNSYRELISSYHEFAPILTADPRDPADVMQAITIALTSPSRTK